MRLIAYDMSIQIPRYDMTEEVHNHPSLLVKASQHRQNESKKPVFRREMYAVL